MELEKLRSFIDATPGPSDTRIDDKARAWLASVGLEVEPGQANGSPVVVVALAVDEDADVRVFAIPGGEIDEAAHAELAAVNGAAFEHHFTADLEPRQFAGAFRICGLTSEEPDVFQDQIDDLRDEVEDDGVSIDFDALVEAAGAWTRYRIDGGATLTGPITHVYSATLCM